MRLALALTLFVLLIEGCGLKGPLYLPKNPPPQQSQPADGGTIQKQ